MNIVFEGDSLSSLTTSPHFSENVVSQLSGYVVSRSIGSQSGDYFPTILADGARLDQCLIVGADHNIAVLWAGTNGLVSTSALMSDIHDWCNARRAAGWDLIIVVSLPPRGGDLSHETLRLEFNALLRSGFVDFADAIADEGADDIVGSYAIASGAPNTYYVDLVHHTEAGQIIDALYVSDAILSLL